MVRRVTTKLFDDLDGSPAGTTVQFSYGGWKFEINLNDQHAHELDEALAPFIKHARELSAGKPRQDPGPTKTIWVKYGEREYGIDLLEEDAVELDELLAPYLDHASEMYGIRRWRPPPLRTERERPSPREIRKWAWAQGMPVSDRGRIPADIAAKYDAAH